MKAKRTVAGVLACAMLVSAAVSVSASAANATVKLAASKETAEAGGTFSVDVSLTDIPASKVNVVDFALNYDATALTVDQVTIGDSANTGALTSDSTAVADAPVFNTSIKDGEITVSWSTSLTSDSWITTDGVILTITGTVKDGTADGVYPIDFAPVARETYEGSGVQNTSMVVGYVYGSDSAAYEITSEAGSVTVGSAVTTTETTVTTGGAATETTTVTTVGTTGPDSTQTPGEVLYGDVNQDGKVDLTDAILLNKAIAGAVNLSDSAKNNADCDANDELGQNDAIVLLKFLVHIIDTLPSAE